VPSKTAFLDARKSLPLSCTDRTRAATLSYPIDCCIEVVTTGYRPSSHVSYDDARIFSQARSNRRVFVASFSSDNFLHVASCGYQHFWKTASRFESRVGSVYGVVDRNLEKYG
jgi:hypothetical protein